MNAWRSRLLLGLIFAATMALHGWLMQYRPHGEVGMTLFYTSAALFDWVLFRICPWVVEGGLCTDMMALCIASVAWSAVGWILYMAYVSPTYYVVLGWCITGVQTLRLLMVDGNGINSVRNFLVRRSPDRPARPVYGAEKQ